MKWCFCGSNSLLGLVWNTGPIGKGVLVILLVMFVVALTFFINRYVIVKEHNRHTAAALEDLKHIKTFDELVAFGLSVRGSLAGVLLKRLIQRAKDLQDRGVAKNFDVFTNQLARCAEQNIGIFMTDAEEYMPYFSAAASMAPLLGLVGTVVGLINAFIGISRLQSVNITVIAPGVAEALVTTFAGLVVALSSLLFFHLVQSKIRLLERQLFAFSDTVIAHIEQVLV
ncbi:MAG: Protein TolQ [candidate division TM6 bacterium GW2011_GWE2_41_16]|nr:MAG: Protein TolQ [candidate division TM6 bacterium GW2011_GWE2_41_16]